MGQYNKKLRIIANVVLFIMTLLCILPLILLVVSSFTAEEVLVQNGYSFFPAKWGLDAYAYLWKTRATLLQAYKMTFIVTTIGVVSSLTVTTLFAYGLSKKHFREEVYLHLWCFFPCCLMEVWFLLI